MKFESALFYKKQKLTEVIMIKHNSLKNYKWIYMSVTALAALALSTQASTKIHADEIDEAKSMQVTTQIDKAKENTDSSSQNISNSVEASVISDNKRIEKTGLKNEEINNKSNQAENSVLDSKNQVSNKNVISEKQLAFNKAVVNVKENISDPNATKEAKDLFGYLKSYTHSDKILFGQQQATVNGVTLSSQEEDGGTQSDVRKLTGKNPAVIGWDIGVIDGDRSAGIKKIAKSMNAFHDEGGIVVISAHPNNFVTGGDYSDTKGDAVKNILPGGTANAKYNKWLDSIVDLSHQLKDRNGKPYAAIYRVFHEQTGAWFWWGNGSTSTDQYIALYRYTVDYFRDHGVHNFLYAYTPGGNLTGDRARYMKTYPGDNYVDVFGVDNYDTGTKQGTKAWFDGVNKDLDTVVNVAEEKGKIPVFAEFGIHLNKDPNKNNCNDWYTKFLNSIESDPVAKKIAYMQTWTNFGFPDNVYVPYKGYGDTAINEDFNKYIHDPRVVTTPSSDFDRYVNEDHQYQTGKHEIVVTVLSPTNYDTVTDNEVPFNVRVDNEENASRAEITINGKTIQLTKETAKAGINFAGVFAIPENQNNTAPQAKVKIYNTQGKLLNTQNLQLYFKFAPKPKVISNIPIKAENIKSNGSWPDAGRVLIKQDNNRVSSSFKAFDPQASWQEIKYEFDNQNPDQIAKANQLEITGLVSADSGLLEAYGTDNKGNKTDYSSTKVDVTTLPTVSYNGKNYKKFDFVINFPEKLKQKNIQFGIVGNYAHNFEQIIFEKAILKELTKEAVKDPKNIDDFSTYLGSDHLLDRAYSTNGDSTNVKLVKNPDGSYAMQFSYNIGPNRYAGRGMTFATPRNWQGAKGISLDLKNASYPGDDLDLQTKMGDVTFEGHIDLAQAHDGVVYVPFTKFAPAGWDTQHKGQTVTDELLKDVGTFWIFINSKVEGQRNITVANIKAVDEAPTPGMPTIPDQPVKPEQPTEPTAPVHVSDNNNLVNNTDITSPAIQNNNVTHNVKPHATVENQSSTSITEGITKVLTHNAYVYTIDLKPVYQNGHKVLLRAGDTIKVQDNGKKYVLQGKRYYRIGENRYVKVANTTSIIKLSHNSFVYDKRGKARKKHGRRILIRRGQRVYLLNNKIVTIKGKHFYQTKQGYFIKARNVKF